MEDKEILAEFKEWQKVRAEEERTNTVKRVDERLKVIEKGQAKLGKNLAKYDKYVHEKIQADKREVVKLLIRIEKSILNELGNVRDRIDNIGVAKVLTEQQTHFKIIEETLLNVVRHLNPKKDEEALDFATNDNSKGGE
jgi:hypothetical protein